MQPAEDSVRQKVLDLVAEKTGYPKDMLDLELDLEADLGVDTVKQAEMFASIRETYDIPRDPNLKLRDFPTLARVIQFVYDHRPDLKAAAPPAAPAPNAPVAAVPAPAEEPRRELATFEAAGRIPRRVPIPAVRPPLELSKPTGVSLGAGPARVRHARPFRRGRSAG